MSLKMNLSEVVERSIKEAVKNAVKEAVYICGSKYNFDGNIALIEIGLKDVELCVVGVGVGGGGVGGGGKVSSSGVGIPLPFSGVIAEECCIALRQNSGLYTQCQSLKAGSSRYCKQCEKKCDSGESEYGTVESRMAVGLQDYVDSKGRKQVHYTKIMKKLNLTEEQVMEVANKHGIKVDASHFIAPVDGSKRGRPKSEKPAKVSSGVKGRPKKEKKVVEIAGDEDDLFANLVAQANRVESEEEVVEVKAEEEAEVKAVEESSVAESSVAEVVAEVKAVAESSVAEVVSEVKAVEESSVAEVVSEVKAEVVEKPAAKVSKTAAEKAAEKAEKEAQKLAEKAAKEAEKAAEKAAKEAQKAAEKAAKDAEKAEKEAQKAADKAAKDTVKKAAVKEDDQAEVVKKIEFAGNKYLKSKKTGIVYDYAEYIKTGDQIVVGQWNNETSAIDFKKACDDEEESEDEYEA
jgi:hypothetical protein